MDCNQEQPLILFKGDTFVADCVYTPSGYSEPIPFPPEMEIACSVLAAGITYPMTVIITEDRETYKGQYTITGDMSAWGVGLAYADIKYMLFGVVSHTEQMVFDVQGVITP